MTTQNIMKPISRKPKSLAGTMVANRAKSKGFTIVELMVSLVLGLLLIGGTISIYLSNQESFRTADAISKVQENGRFAFELMSRDLRDAGSNPCALKAVSSVIRDASATTPWWADWASGTVVGYDGNQTGGGAVVGTLSGNRVTATDAITVLRTSLDDGDLRTIQGHDYASTSITLNTVTGYQAVTPVLACDFSSGAIFDVWAVSNSLVQLDHQTTSPSLNCTVDFSYPLQTDCTGGTSRTFAVGGYVTKLDSGFWYIGINSRGTRSLYRHTITRGLVGGVTQIVTEAREMVPDVQDMQIEYLTRDRTLTSNDLAASWITASDAVFSASNGEWREMTIGANTKNNQEVVAVRITLSLVAPDGYSIEGVPITRTTYGVIKLRNREVKS
jgi:type IV pilus assembly protein PilW